MKIMTFYHLIIICIFNFFVTSCGGIFGEKPMTFDVKEESQSDSTIQRHAQHHNASEGDDSSSKTKEQTRLIEKRETFRQSERGVLDLLIVVDNSGSMKEEQQGLATRMAPLLSEIQDSDYQISIVTTDPSDGCQRALLKKGMLDLDKAFSSAIQAGTTGSGNERGVLMARAGLQNSFDGTGFTGGGSCSGLPWLRPNSSVGVLFLTDEDNCSNGSDCGSDPWGSPEFLANYLSSIRTLGVDARVHGLITLPEGGQCSSSNNKKGYQYASLIQKTSGTMASICDADYSPALAQISRNIASTLKDQFFLKDVPVPGTFKVSINGKIQSSGYQINGRTLTFFSPPQANAEISVDYAISAAGQ